MRASAAAAISLSGNLIGSNLTPPTAGLGLITSTRVLRLKRLGQTSESICAARGADNPYVHGRFVANSPKIAFPYVRIAVFALAAIGSASFKSLNVISRAYRLLPSASCPRCREYQIAH